MNRVFKTLVLAALATPSVAFAGSGEKRLAAYDSCVMNAAVRASYTTVANEDVFAMTRTACAKARAQAARDSHVRPLVEAADAHRAVNLRYWINDLRDTRRNLDALYGAPDAALR